MSRKALALAVAGRVCATRYAGAEVTFVAGSIMRGDDTEFSDIDLVVIYPELETAYRESFIAEGFPVEAFVHDPETLRYFFREIDRKSGFPSLQSMVSEGVAIPDSADARYRAEADAALCAGPPSLSPEELKSRHYMIGDLIDDLRAPRNMSEVRATGAKLYEVIADYYFRSQGKWSAKGKTIPRRLVQADSEFSKRFEDAFVSLFVDAKPGPLIALSEALLAPAGGFVFDGYRQVAPAAWRASINE